MTMDTDKRIKNSKGSNSGFSMVELIVVLAVTAVTIGFATMSYTLVSRSNVNKAAKYVDSAFTLCRNRAMASSGDWRIVIKNGGVSVVKHVEENVGGTVQVTEEAYSENSLPKNVDVYVGQSADAGLKKLGTDCDSINICYNMLNGDVRDVFAVSGSSDIQIKDSSSSYCYLVFKYKDKKECRIKIYYSTGKHAVEKG